MPREFIQIGGGRVMNYPYPATREQVLYQADPNAVATLWSIRDRTYQVSNANKDRLVRVHTLDGHTYEGVIVNVDSRHVYLRPSHPAGQRGFFFGPSEAAILTLVLFELLVIVLLA